MSDTFHDVIVVCYEGYRAEQEPRRFHAAGRDFEVAEILDRWLDPDHRYFKVRGRDEGVYLLRHDPRGCSWTLRILQYGWDPGLP